MYFVFDILYSCKSQTQVCATQRSGVYCEKLVSSFVPQDFYQLASLKSSKKILILYHLWDFMVKSDLYQMIVYRFVIRFRLEGGIRLVEPIYKFARSERLFHHQLSAIQKSVIEPLLKTGRLSLCFFFELFFYFILFFL